MVAAQGQCPAITLGRYQASHSVQLSLFSDILLLLSLRIVWLGHSRLLGQKQRPHDLRLVPFPGSLRHLQQGLSSIVRDLGLRSVIDQQLCRHKSAMPDRIEQGRFPLRIPSFEIRTRLDQ